MKKYLLLIAAALVVVGCKKKDEGPKEIPTPPKVAKNQVEVDMGGANEPYQVYVDLATKQITKVRRDAWDIAFYCGDDFRVIINPAIAMTVTATTRNINEFVHTVPSILLSDDPTLPSQVLISSHIIDDPRGHLSPSVNSTTNEVIKGTGTAIAEIAVNDVDNKVYLLNLGSNISTKTPEIGSVDLKGSDRGWMKVQIMRRSNAYRMLYAHNYVTADTKGEKIEEVTINKNPLYNFIFFSLHDKKIVQVQPPKTNWDLCFTAATSWFSTDEEKILSPQNSVTFFPDLVVTNLHGGTKATLYDTRTTPYNTYSKEKAGKIAFGNARYNTQMAIGRNWRDNQVGNLVRDELFAVVRDSEGRYYKLKFLRLKDDKGERGYPAFEYEEL